MSKKKQPPPVTVQEFLAYPMRIVFKKDYKDDTRWPAIVLDFLAELSTQYGYTIDEYDMLAMVWQARQERLGALLNSGENDAMVLREFKRVCAYGIIAKNIGAEKRRLAKLIKDCL
jgi:hypothetical protein